MENIGVNITYKNAKQETVCDKTYTLKEYTDMLHTDLLRLITDVEDMAYKFNSGKPKTEWTDESWVAFCCIKHKLLDKAGEIERLPQNLVEYHKDIDDDQNLHQFVASVFGKSLPVDMGASR